MKKLDSHKISKYIHGTFGEFFGSTTYDGIWVGKDSDIPNINGIRLDVIEGIRECGLTVFRWPGGCCAEKYHWMDGIGQNRMPRMHFQEDNNNWIWDMSFGTDEFMEFCELCNMEPMLVANVSTGTPEELRAWFEYCNAPKETKYGAMRAENGHPEPYNVRILGIGNTDENAWKAAFIPEIYAYDYLRFTSGLDGNWLRGCTTVGLGLSIRHGHGDWPARVMDLITRDGTTPGPDMLSVHHYLGSMKDKKCGDSVNYTDEEYYYLIDSLVKYSEDIDFHRQLIDKHSCHKRKTYLAIDEWGTWHDDDDVVKATHQRQTLRDAIFAAMAMHIFYRNSDIVAMAMQTQISNLNESLFDTDGDKFLRTPTFWVMKLFREHIGQYLLSDAFVANEGIDAVGSISEDANRVTITAVNKDLYNKATLTLGEELMDMKITMSDIITADTVRSLNTYDDPDRVRSHSFKATLPEITLPEHSVVRIVLSK